MYSTDEYWVLEVVVHASAGYDTWYKCYSRSCTCVPHIAKSACMCKGVESQMEEKCTEPERK